MPTSGPANWQRRYASDDEKATFRGNFFMDTEAGKEAYKLAKAMGDLQNGHLVLKSTTMKLKDISQRKWKKK